MVALGWGFRAEAHADSFAHCWGQAEASVCSALSTPRGWHGFALQHKLVSPAGTRLQAWTASHANLASTLWHGLPPSALAGIATPTQSTQVLQRFGTGSVCEALALLGASRLWPQTENHVPLSPLWLTRVTSKDRLATLAVAVSKPSTRGIS